MQDYLRAKKSWVQFQTPSIRTRCSNLSSDSALLIKSIRDYSGQDIIRFEMMGLAWHRGRVGASQQAALGLILGPAAIKKTFRR